MHSNQVSSQRGKAAVKVGQRFQPVRAAGEKVGKGEKGNTGTAFDGERGAHECAQASKTSRDGSTTRQSRHQSETVRLACPGPGERKRGHTIPVRKASNTLRDFRKHRVTA